MVVLDRFGEMLDALTKLAPRAAAMESEGKPAARCSSGAFDEEAEPDRRTGDDHRDCGCGAASPGLDTAVRTDGTIN